jgi:aspartate 1-decarboxylase
MRTFLRSKIHHATVTEANLEYMGSVTIDATLMDLADIQEWEKVLVADLTNGTRLETYAIRGPADSGAIEINGAAAHLVKKGDQVILMTFESAERPSEPRCVLVDEKNQFVKYLTERPSTVPSF